MILQALGVLFLPSTSRTSVLSHRRKMYLSRLLITLLISAITSIVLVQAIKSPNNEIEKMGLDWHERAAEKGAVCNQDNTLRALLANRASVTPFCSSFNKVPHITVYSPTATATPVTTQILLPASGYPLSLSLTLYSRQANWHVFHVDHTISQPIFALSLSHLSVLLSNPLPPKQCLLLPFKVY